MKILKLHFYLLVCCGAAESFTEKLVDLGQNVTLKCEVSVKDVLWFLMKPSEPPAFILRSYSSKSTRAEYSNPTFSRTFSLQCNSSLFIHNISTNELGVYYCIQTGSPPDISIGIRLYITNHSAVTHEIDQQAKQTADGRKCEALRLWQSLFITLGVINCLVVAVFTACAVHCCKRPPKTQARPPASGLHLHQENTEPVYAQVQLATTSGGVRTTNLNSTYAILRPPNP